MPKLHKNPYRWNNTTGAYSFWRKLLLINMTNILTAVKGGIHSYWDKVYSRCSFNQMWILKYFIFWIIVIIVLIRNFVCPNMWLLYTLLTIQRGNVSRRFKISLRTRLSSKWYETVHINNNTDNKILCNF